MPESLFTPGGGSGAGFSGGMFNPGRIPVPTTSGPGVSDPKIHQIAMNWTKRLPSLKQKGFDYNQHIAPVIQYDKQRVMQGTTPLGNSEAMDLVTAVKTGHEPLRKDQGHDDILGIPGTHILGNAVGDIQQSVAGLFQIPGALIHDVPAFAKDLAHGMPEWTNPTTSSGLPDWSKGLSELEKTPLVRFLPGLNTLSNVAHGTEGKQLEQHPILSALDVAPYASTLSKLATMGVSAEDAGPIVRALQEGKPLKALTRSPIFPSRTGLRPLTGSAWENRGLLEAPTEKGGLTSAISQQAGTSKEVRALSLAREQLQRAPRAGGAAEAQLARVTELQDEYQRVAEEAYHNHTLDTEEVKQRLDGIKAELGGIDKTGKMTGAYGGFHTAAMTEWLATAVPHVVGVREEAAIAENAKAIGDGLFGKETRWKPETTLRQIARQDRALALQEKIDTANGWLKRAEEWGKEGRDTGLTGVELKEAAKRVKKWQAQLNGLKATATREGKFANAIEQRTFQERYVPMLGRESMASAMGLDKLARDELKTQLAEFYGTHQIYVPRWLFNAFTRDEKLNAFLRKSSGVGTFDKFTDLFKYAVLTGPRHVVHIFASNLVFGLLEKPGAIFSPHAWMRTLDIMHHPEKWAETMPGMPRGMQLYRGAEGEVSKLSDTLRQFKTDWMASLGQGKSLGRIFVERYGGAAPRAFRAWENYIMDFSRSMLFVYEHDRQLAKGFEETEAARAGQQLVLKTLMNTDDMAPIERGILRRVMPFYAFTRHLLRYMMRYPADHPFRTAVLANIGAREMADQKNDLPWKMDSLFFLGTPDQQGNVSAIDMKNWNPFRSMEGNNPFTLAGFLSEFHPGLQAMMQLSGGTPLSATPELFPQLTVDQVSGNLVAKHDGAIPTVLEDFVPPFSSLDMLFNLSGRFRTLQQSSKGGGTDVWRKQLFSYLNIPFVPFKVNVKTEEAKFAAHWFSTAKADLKNALSSGDTGSLWRYRMLPITEGSGFRAQSGFITPEVLDPLLQHYQQIGAQ